MNSKLFSNLNMIGHEDFEYYTTREFVNDSLNLFLSCNNNSFHSSTGFLSQNSSFDLISQSCYLSTRNLSHFGRFFARTQSGPRACLGQWLGAC